MYIKIDIEGSEKHAFSNADRFFEVVEVVGVMIEWKKQSAADTKFFLDFFKKHDLEPSEKFSKFISVEDKLKNLEYVYNVFFPALGRNLDH